MGLFLHTAIIQNCDETTARLAVENVAKNKELDVKPAECLYKVFPHGVNILFNEYCSGYELLAKTLSEEIGQPTLILFIYDDDFWGYFLYDKGKEKDAFNPIPDYFDDVDDAEVQRLTGNADVIAKYFDISPDSVTKYLTFWTEDLFEESETAYEEDEFEYGNCWQMADFMNAVGYPYEWE
jgi:hypothetical protein